jgi:hypothetical protein
LEVAVGNFSRATGAGAEIDQTPSARHGIEFSIFEARRSVRSSLVVSVVLPAPDLHRLIAPALLAPSLLFDHLIGAGKQHGRHLQAKRLGSLEIDD